VLAAPPFGKRWSGRNPLSQAKGRHQTDSITLVEGRSLDVIFEPQDFDPNHDRDATHQTILKTLQDVVGCENVIGVERVSAGIRAMKARGMDSHDSIPTIFIFKDLR